MWPQCSMFTGHNCRLWCFFYLTQPSSTMCLCCCVSVGLILTITAGAFAESYEGKHLSIQVNRNNLNLDNKESQLISWNQFLRRCFGLSLQRRFGSPVHLEFKWCIRDRSPCGVCEVSWWKQPGREAFQLAWFMRDLDELVMRGAEDSQRSVQRAIYVLTE